MDHRSPELKGPTILGILEMPIFAEEVESDKKTLRQFSRTRNYS